jgi:hypothetical protein
MIGSSTNTTVEVGLTIKGVAASGRLHAIAAGREGAKIC